MNDYTLNETFFISQDQSGSPLEQPAAEGEVVCLAYDYNSAQLVELHLLTESGNWSADQARSLFERLVLLAGVNGGSVPRIIRKGKMDGLLFFTVALEEGESVANYVRRNGGLPERVTLELLQGVLKKLQRLQELPRLFRACSLEDAKLIYSPQGPHHQRVIQIRRFGLHQPEARVDDDVAENKLACELGELVYQMLTGHPSPVRGGPIVESVRLLDRCFLLRQFVIHALERGSRRLTLAEASQALRAAEQFVSDTGLGITSLPAFDVAWVNQVFGTSNLDVLYPVQFEPQGPLPDRLEAVNSRPMLDTKLKESVYLLPLPGRRIVPRPPFEPAPEGLGQVEPVKTSHLLLPHSTWNSEAFSFHVETKRNGFSIKHFLRQRGALQASEIVSILRQVEAGMEQAKSLGLKIPSLQSSAIQCVFLDDCDERQLEQRAQLTVSDWPSHQIKIRVHATLNSLTAPWPVGADPDRPERGRLSDAFLLLAVELAGGPEAFTRKHLPDDLTEFFKQQLVAVGRKDPTPEPWAILKSIMQRGGVFQTPALPVVPVAAPVAPVVAEVVQPEPVAEVVPVAPEVVEMAPAVAEMEPLVEPVVEPEIEPAVEAVVEPVAQIAPPAQAPQPESVEAYLPATSPAAIAAKFQVASKPIFHPIAEETVTPVAPPVEEIVTAPEVVAEVVAKEIPPTPEPEPVVEIVAEAAPEIAPEVPEPVQPEPTPVSEVVEPTPVAEPSMFGQMFREKAPEPIISPISAEVSPQPATPEPPVFEATPEEGELDVTPFPIEAVEPLAPVAEIPAPEPVVTPAPPAVPAAVHTDALDETENLMDDDDPSDLDNGVPTLNIDLARLTTSDSLFSRRTRTITIRNR